MKSLLKTIFSITLLCTLYVNANAQFKIVGYVRPRANMVAEVKTIDLSALTHLNVAFINPDTSGMFKDMPQLDTVVQLAHAKNVKVLLSCGGGSRQKYYYKLLKQPYRTALVKNFTAFVKKYKLDGIDVDLEGDDIDDNYEDFVIELKSALGKKKLLTAALAFYTRKRISDEALKQMDFINMMAYDKTGPWRANDFGQHSPISYALDHLNYWSNERNVPKDKLVIGVPFYGYGFGDMPSKNRFYREMGWKDIIKTFPNDMDNDEVVLPNNGGSIFYNGKKTIKEKTELAMKQAGGIMIWQLMHDTADDNSLLKLIKQTSLTK